MSHNPLDSDNRSFPALFKDAEQQSRRPSLTGVPPGRRAAYGAASRATSRQCVEQNWTDIRSKSRRAVTA